MRSCIKWMVALALLGAAWAQQNSEGTGWSNPANTIYIAPSTASPAGNDANPCTLSLPCMSLGHAVTVLRANPSKRVVVMRDGLIPLTTAGPATVVFTPTDGGIDAAHNWVFMAYPGEHPIVDGGRSIQPGQAGVLSSTWGRDATVTCPGCDPAGALVIDLDIDPTHATAFPNFDQLWLNDRRMQKTRTTSPTTYAFNAGPVCRGPSSMTQQQANRACGCDTASISATSGATESGNVVTITFSAVPTFPFSVGDIVAIGGVTNTGYNGSWTITAVPSSTQIQYVSTRTGLTSSGNGSVGIDTNGDGVFDNCSFLQGGQSCTANGAKSVTAASESGTTVTITTSASIGVHPGDTIVLAGVGVSGYNGSWTITAVPTSTTFQYTASTSGLGSSSGGTATLDNNYLCLNQARFSGNQMGMGINCDIGDCDLLTFENWTVSRQILKSVNTSTKIATFAGPASQSDGNSGWLDGHRFLQDGINPKSTLPSPVLKAGQWFFSRCDALTSPPCTSGLGTVGRLYYMPTAGENIALEKIMVSGMNPLSPWLVTMTQSHFITFSGVEFRHDGYRTGKYGTPATQGNPLVQPEVLLTDTQYITFDNDTFDQTGGGGISFQSSGLIDLSACSDTTSRLCGVVTNSLFYDLGSYGIKFGTDIRKSGPTTDVGTNLPQNFTVADVWVTYTGQYDPSGIGQCIWVGQAHHGTILHNECSFAPGGGFEIGRKLNRSEPLGGTGYTTGMIVYWNFIHDIGLGLISDFAGIYSSVGKPANCAPGSPPTLVPFTYCNDYEFNLIKDVTHNVAQSAAPEFAYGGQGLYQDQGDSWGVFRFNMVIRASESCIFQNLSDRTSDVFEEFDLYDNNVLIDCGAKDSNIHQAIKTGGKNPTRFNFTHNIVSFDSTIANIQNPGFWWANQTVNVSSASESGSTVTVTTSTPHGMIQNQTVTLSGVGTGYNGTQKITSTPTNTTFTFTASPGLSTQTTGTVFAPAVNMFFFDNNSYWNRAAGNSLTNQFQLCAVQNCSSYTLYNLAGWQGVGEDVHSVNRDPLFPNYAADLDIPQASFADIGFIPFSLAGVGRRTTTLNPPPSCCTQYWPLQLLDRSTEYSPTTGGASENMIETLPPQSSTVSAARGAIMQSRTDTTYPTPPSVPPSGLIGLTGANSCVTDPLNAGGSGNLNCRITDSTLAGASSSFSSTSDANFHIWGFFDDWFLVHTSPGGGARFFSWNGATHTATPKGFSPQSSTKQSIPGDSFNTGWTAADAYSFYGSGNLTGAPTTVNRYTLDITNSAWTCPSASPPGNCGLSNNLSGAITTQVLLDPISNPATCPGAPINRWMSPADIDISFDANRVNTLWWYQQDYGSVNTIWDRTAPNTSGGTGACRWYDSRTGQIGGNWVGAPNGIAKCGGSSSAVSPLCATGQSMPAPAAAPTSAASTGTLTASHVYKIAMSRTQFTVGETKASPIATITGSSGYTITPPTQPTLIGSTAESALKATGWNFYSCDETTEGSNCTPHLQSAIPAPVMDVADSSCVSNCGSGGSTITYWVVAHSNTAASALSAPVTLNWNGSGSVNESVCFTASAGATTYSLLRDRTDSAVKVKASAVQGSCPSGKLQLVDSGGSMKFFAIEGAQITNNFAFTSYSSTGNASTCEPNTTGSVDPCTGTAGLRSHGSGIDRGGIWNHKGGAVSQQTQYSNGSTGVMIDWYIPSLTVVGAMPFGDSNYALNIANVSPGHDIVGFGHDYADNQNSTMHYENYATFNTDAAVEDASQYFIGCCSPGPQPSTLNTYDKHYSLVPSNNPSVFNPLFSSSEPNSGTAFNASPATWRGEIIGISTDPANNTTWRYCYNYATGASWNGGTAFYSSSRGNISTNQNWFLYTSDMLANSFWTSPSSPGHEGKSDTGLGSITGNSTCAVGQGATTALSESSSTVTVTTAANPHNLAVGDSVIIAGVTPSGYNGTFPITAVTANTFTYTDGTTGLGSATVQGTYTVQSPINACRYDLFVCQVTPVPGTPTISVSMAPTSVSIVTAGTQQFTATVNNSTNQQVNWDVNGFSQGNPFIGTIDATGFYTAPASILTQGLMVANDTADCTGSNAPNASCNGAYTGEVVSTYNTGAQTQKQDASPGNVSWVPWTKYMYPNFSGQFWPEIQPWFYNVTPFNGHINIGLNMSNTAAVKAQVSQIIGTLTNKNVTPNVPPAAWIDYYGLGTSQAYNKSVTDAWFNEALSRCTSSFCPMQFTILLDKGAITSDNFSGVTCPQDGGGISQATRDANCQAVVIAEWDYVEANYCNKSGVTAPIFVKAAVGGVNKCVVSYFLSQTDFTNPTPTWSTILTNVKTHTSAYAVPFILLGRAGSWPAPSYYDGYYAWPQPSVFGAGTVTTSGTTVTWVSGTKFDSSWTGAITVNGVSMTIASVSSCGTGANTCTTITLTATAGSHTGVNYAFQNQSQFGWQDITGGSTCNAVTGVCSGSAYLGNFYTGLRSQPATIFGVGGAWKGFSWDVAGWKGFQEKVMAQQCGRVLGYTTGQAFANGFSAALQLKYMGLDTWNDHEEGTELETGVSNCVSTVTQSLAGNILTIGRTVSDATYFSTGTIDHYSVIYTDGTNTYTAADNLPASTTTLDLTNLVCTGSWTVYTQMVGMPGILNVTSSGISYTSSHSCTPQTILVDATSVADPTKSATAPVTVQTGAAPTIKSLSPPQGFSAGGETITVNGTNFASGAAVTLGGVAATTTFVNSTKLTFVAPAGSDGQVDVTVTNPGPVPTATKVKGYYYLDTPTTTCSFSTHTINSCNISYTDQFGPITRIIRMFYPSGLTNPALVLYFHGAPGGQFEGCDTLDPKGWQAKATAIGFIYACPEGWPLSSGTKTWNSYYDTATYSEGHAPDDSYFVREVAALFYANAGIDPKQVFLTGFSAGGVGIHRYAIDDSDLIAAIGGQATTYWQHTLTTGLTIPNAIAPVSVINLQSTADTAFKYCGVSNSSIVTQDMDDLFNFWTSSANDNCQTITPSGSLCTAELGTFTSVTSKLGTSCAGGAEVQMYQLTPGQHSYYTSSVSFTTPPGTATAPYNPNVNGTTGTNAIDILWNFFAAHPKQ